jgi:hypothetical protein
MRQLGVFVALLLALLHPVALAATMASRATTLVPPSTRDDKIRMEADYILACQYLGAGWTFGAINNVYGPPTWVVPRKNGVAILGLLEAARVLGDEKYMIGAQSAADYLVKAQQLQDGCWCDQYYHGTPTTMSKSTTQTAQVMIAFFKLGYQGDTADPRDRYDAMKKGAECLMAFQEVENKGGQDDGLLCGGKDADGAYRNWRWAHDNAYAYWALRMAAFWANQGGESDFANQCNRSAEQIEGGLMAHLYDDNTGVWRAAIDENGDPQWITGLEGRPSWVQYAPVMLDLPLGVDRNRVGEWMRTMFQQADGSVIGLTPDGEGEVTRKYPGYAFQSSLVWLDTEQMAYAQAAVNWAETSGLWQTEPDDQDVTGGWVEWIEVTPNPDIKPETWERYIDTSAYAILAWNGGYNFGMPVVSLPLMLH